MNIDRMKTFAGINEANDDPYKTLDLKSNEKEGIKGYKRPSYDDFKKLAKKKGLKVVTDALWDLKKREARTMNSSTWHNDIINKLNKEMK